MSYIVFEYKICVFHDKSPRKYGTGPGSNLATPGYAVRHVSAVRKITNCTMRSAEGALWDHCNQYGRPQDKSVNLKINRPPSRLS